MELHGENLGNKEGPSHGDHQEVLDDGHCAHWQVEHRIHDVKFEEFE